MTKRGMTKEEKIAELINIRDNYNYTLAPKEVFDDAIKALKQEDILEKIIAEIWEEAEWAYSDFDDYKATVLEVEIDELPDDEFRFGLHRAVEIINKYRKDDKEWQQMK